MRKSCFDLETSWAKSHERTVGKRKNALKKTNDFRKVKERETRKIWAHVWLSPHKAIYVWPSDESKRQSDSSGIIEEGSGEKKKKLPLPSATHDPSVCVERAQQRWATDTWGRGGWDGERMSVKERLESGSGLKRVGEDTETLVET